MFQNEKTAILFQFKCCSPYPHGAICSLPWRSLGMLGKLAASWGMGHAGRNVCLVKRPPDQGALHAISHRIHCKLSGSWLSVAQQRRQKTQDLLFPYTWHVIYVLRYVQGLRHLGKPTKNSQKLSRSYPSISREHCKILGLLVVGQFEK